MFPARARTWTARSGDERTNHEATAPPFATSILWSLVALSYYPKLILYSYFSLPFCDKFKLTVSEKKASYHLKRYIQTENQILLSVF